MEDAESQTLRIKLLDSDHDVEMEELDPGSSPYTGHELRRVQVSFQVAAERSEAVNDELSAAREADQALSADGSRWTVHESSHSYQDGSPSHSYRAELHEIEEPVKAERVEMLGLSLVPSRYKEEADEDDGTLVISFLVAVEAGDDAILESAIQDNRQSGEYFEAVRVGVSEEPLQVRFGRCLWRREEDGRLHLLRLVGDSQVTDKDAGPWARLHQPQLRRSQKKIAALEDTVSGLIEQLEKAGVLDSGAAAAIGAGTADSWSRHVRDFDEAGDLESFF
jgi:hypothetical protein